MDQRSRRDAPGLNLLRGLAAIAVMVIHARSSSFVEFGALPVNQQTWLVALFFALTRVGQEAVLIFFVLSGFLVGGRVIDHFRRGTFNATTYAVDRSTRIMLPLIPACLFTAGVNLLIFNQPMDPAQLVGNMLGLNGVIVGTLPRNAPLWSLAYEIWFYVLAGSVAALLAKPTLIVAALAILSALTFAVLGPEYLLYWWLGAAAFAYRDTEKMIPLLIVGMALALFGTIFLELSSDSKSFHTITILTPATARAVLCLGICMMLPALSAPWTFKSFERPAAALSSFSYTLYLTHYPILSVVDTVLLKADTLSVSSFAHFFVRVSICTFVGVAFYYCFERNTNRLRRIAHSVVRRRPGTVG